MKKKIMITVASIAALGAVVAGYRMALSDVVELYDDSGSEFFYCDRVGFRPIQFNQHQEQNECHEMTM